MSAELLPEKNEAAMAEREDATGRGDAADMYHAVVKESNENLKTEGADVDDMYRMGKQQQFKVRRRLCPCRREKLTEASLRSGFSVCPP